MTTRVNVTPEDLRHMDLGALIGKTLISDNPEEGRRVWEFEFELGSIHKTEWYAANDFLEATKAARNETDGQRWGDTRRIATVPMHIAVREWFPRIKDGNDGSLKRWLNDSENRPFRTFNGTV